MSRQIIVTGGLGYIGSHTIVELKDYFDEFIVIDDLSNSNLLNSSVDSWRKVLPLYPISPIN